MSRRSSTDTWPPSSGSSSAPHPHPPRHPAPRTGQPSAPRPHPARRTADLSVRLRVMQSNGGLDFRRRRRASRRRCARFCRVPAAGCGRGPGQWRRRRGFPRVISFDMGGTSTDVSLIDGKIATSTDSRVGDFPVRLPVIDIHTVGAGGGSIAAIDSGGALRVGPRSAGAVPGPACYGTGSELTVTDAESPVGAIGSPSGFWAGGCPSTRAAPSRWPPSSLGR